MEKKEDTNSISDHVPDLLQSLEQQTNWDGRPLVKYDGFWCPSILLRPLLSFQKYFEAKNTDIILATLPKSGTTWLKALASSIANRSIYPIDQSPVLTTHPHELVLSLEFGYYFHNDNPDMEHLPNPRIFSTHFPFKALPESIRDSECKIIYICRNPMDQFISHRHFALENKFVKGAVPLEMEETFDKYCYGVHPLGPFWDHMLGYWNASLKNPEKVLFLKYEDLKKDINSNVKKIAEFLGCPFSLEEEEQGLVEGIARLCSFESLKNLEVNKSGHIGGVMKKDSYFRKGEVGDWINHLTPAMAERIKKLMESKWDGSGLMFET